MTQDQKKLYATENEANSSSVNSEMTLLFGGPQRVNDYYELGCINMLNNKLMHAF